MKLTQFNLNHWLQFGQNSILRTRSYLTVLNIKLFTEISNKDEYCIAGIVQRHNPERTSLIMWNQNGEINPGKIFHEDDLMMMEVKRPWIFRK